MVHFFDDYVTFNYKIFVQLLTNCSRFAANLNMKAVSFFTHPVQWVLKKTEL